MSTSLPFSKQYYSGGPNSVRGFRVRTIGPGSYQLPDSITSSSSFFDRTGDIRLEANLEFRHPIVSLLHGAVFVDAGNIWLYNDNPALPGGKFSSSWSQEIAISAGYGVRLDIDFVVIRVDIGTPIRFPYEKGNSHWQDEFKISYKSWRQDNIIWNFSIGYPF
jgi:outer membrane protein assembly factor BamA